MNLDHEHDSSVDIDEDAVDDYDESQQRGTGMCRGCKTMKHDVLADNGYCGDCD